MLLTTIILRRLFTHKPSQTELNFHWWFVEGGYTEWHSFMSAKGLTLSRRNRIVRKQEKHSRKVLETWDTQAFQQFVFTGTGRVVDETLPHGSWSPIVAADAWEGDPMDIQFGPGFYPDHWPGAQPPHDDHHQHHHLLNHAGYPATLPQDPQ